MGDIEVDKAYGTSDVNFIDSKNRSHNLVIHRLLTKYRLIFEIAEQLPSDVKLMKQYIMKTISDMNSEMTTIVDIQDFKKSLNSNSREKVTFLITNHTTFQR